MKQFVLLLAGAISLLAADMNPDARQVMAAMESFKKAMIGRDKATLDKLLSDDLMYVHSAGQVETKEHFIDVIGSGKSITEKLEFTDPMEPTREKSVLAQGRKKKAKVETKILESERARR